MSEQIEHGPFCWMNWQLSLQESGVEVAQRREALLFTDAHPVGFTNVEDLGPYRLVNPLGNFNREPDPG